MLGIAGEALSFCQRIDLDKVGVNLDIEYSILAGERPAQALVILARASRLFYVHLNDNDGAGDWDLIPGAFNFWEFIEFLYYIHIIGYDDWFAYDVFPKEINTIDNFDTVTFVTLKLMSLVKKIDSTKIEELFKKEIHPRK